jgi:hypothetical protein
VTRIHRRYIAARDKTVPLYIFRVVLFLLWQRRGVAGLGELRWASRRRGQRPGHYDEIYATKTSGAAGNGPGTTIK